MLLLFSVTYNEPTPIEKDLLVSKICLVQAVSTDIFISTTELTNSYSIQNQRKIKERYEKAPTIKLLTLIYLLLRQVYKIDV